VGDCLAADPHDQVVRETVRLQLLAEGIVQPRRREAGALDLVHVGYVLEPHGLDAHLQRRSGDHVISAAAAAMPRGSATYAGTSVAGSAISPALSAALPRRARAAAKP